MDARQRIFRVPAGFMRNKTQERIEELAREKKIGDALDGKLREVIAGFKAAFVRQGEQPPAPAEAELAATA